MHKLLELVLVLSIIVILAGSVIYTATGTISAEKPRFAQRVVLFSIDAAKPEIMYKLAQEGNATGFKFIMENGYYASGMIVSFPSATAVSHAVISTGAPPNITGITGNAIHLPGTPIYKKVSGFDGRYLLAEPIWVTADRQGLKAVVASFPQSTPSVWKDVVKNSILFNPYGAFVWPISYSTLYTTNTSIPRATYITFSTPPVNWTGSLGVSVYLAYESNIKIGDDTWYLYLADTDNDEYPDLLAICPNEKNLNKAVAILREGEWSEPINTTITYKGQTYVVAPRFKALNLSIVNFKLYRSLMRPFNAEWFSDYDTAWRVWNEVVVKTGMITDGDWYALVNGWIDEDTYMETVYFTNEFFKQFTIWLIENTDWDLLLTYTPIVDNVQHQFLGLIDPSMPYYDPVKAPKYEKYVYEAYLWADEITREILNHVDLSDTAVIVISDHGQWSVAKLVYINNILMEAGLLKVDSNGKIVWSETKAYYVGYNQIFVNLQGREEGGIVPPDEYESVVNAIKAALEKTVDPDTGEPVFSLVMSRDEACIFGLCGERAGDVVFSLRPGYAPQGGIGSDVFKLAEPLKTITGTHGDLPYYEDLLAIFGAVGAGIGHGKLGLIKSTSIAPTISLLLGIDPPANATGNPLLIVEPYVITETETTTTTETQTATRTVTTTQFSTSTIVTTSISTTTETATVKETQIVTTTATTTREVKTPDWGITGLVGVVLLIIGLIVGYLVKR
ncbi:MAG: alkaline phosphatase family protein [Thermoprotei archaeon]